MTFGLGGTLLLIALAFSTVVLIVVTAIRAILGRDRSEAEEIAANLEQVVEEACEMQVEPRTDALLAELLAYHRREDPVRVLRGRKPRAAAVVKRQPPERRVTPETVALLRRNGASADLVRFAEKRVDAA